MKSVIKVSSVILLVASIFMFNSCNNSGNEKPVTAEDNHEHIYACPMHPEVTGHEGEKCSKCGMTLEHNDTPVDNKVTYVMKFVASAATIEPKKEVTLSFTPTIKGNESQPVALDVEHEKKLHLIMASDDLSWFAHEHPEYNADGSYKLNFSFPAPGKYFLFADYKPTGGNHALEKIEINVAGIAAAAKKWGADKETSASGNYAVTLLPLGKKWITKTAVHVLGQVKKDGKEIDANTLENYLGAKAHMVVLRLEDKEYLHIHPGVDHGKLHLHGLFEKAGLHRAWIQINADGKIQTFDFVLNVKEGTPETIKEVNEAAANYHSGQ